MTNGMAKPPVDDMPSLEQARSVFAPALGERLQTARRTLERLGAHAPQVLIFEGGDESERAALALWEAALLNCPHAEGGEPCLACPVCLQVGAGLHQNLIVLDGRKGHIPIASVRALRASLGEAPHGSGHRAVVFMEAQFLGMEAANALLKSMEEPKPGTVFLLLAPQRERLLPTLVSRGWVMTLPWPELVREDSALREWTEALRMFLSDGRGWFGRTSVKGAVDAPLARRVLLAVQKSLAAAMRAPYGASLAGPDAVLAQLPEAGRAYVAEVLAQCQDSLDAMVNPALVLDWMAVRLYLAVRTVRR